MPDYKNTKIYKIYSPSNEDLVYIGHTTKQYLSQRLAKHLSDYNQWKRPETKNNKVSSYNIFEQCNDYHIMLLESYPCNDVNEARARERYYIENNKCLNRNIPGRTKKECDKLYQENNKEKIAIDKKLYAIENVEHLTQYRADYYDNKKDEIKGKVKAYRESNIDKIKENKCKTILCECGMTFQKTSIARHRRSQKHLSFISQLE